MRPVGSHRTAGFGQGRDQIERTATDAGQKNPAPVRQCWGLTEAAWHSDFGRRDVIETANQATQTRLSLFPYPTVAAAEPASAVRRRTDPAHLEEAMVAATKGEMPAGLLSND
jgi:hypothetical protein